jgi:endonuclease/exonuclease/phosphatase family metal-dependent hydrolase
MRTKRRRFAAGCAALAVAFVVFLAYRTIAVYTWRPGPCPVARSTVPEAALPVQRTLTVMSYNIEGHATLIDENHIEEIAEVINRFRPDVVGLQETHVGTWQARRTNQVRQLARLTGMKAAFGRSFTSLGGHFGNAVLTRGEIAGGVVYHLPSIGEPRSLLQTTIRIDGRYVNVFVGHLAAWGRINRSSRLSQAECVDRIASASTIPFVVVGDFNAIASAPEMVRLLDSRTMRPVGELDVPTHKITKEHLDFVFADPGWKVKQWSVPQTGPSDHWPLLATLERLEGPHAGS